MMTKSTSLIWFRRLLVLVAVVAGATASAAGAAGRPPAVQDAATTNLAALISPPDVRDAASESAVAVADAFERFVAAHPFGKGLSSALGEGLSSALGEGLSSAQSAQVSRPPDIRDTALALGSQSTGVGRPPDVDDTALAVRYGSVVHTSGFDWADWAIGTGSGVGLAIFLAAGLLMGRQLRHRMQTA
jgi:hypothetical protein